MALSANVAWDVRTTGSDSNGGGFDSSVGSPGTDFSQQNAAQVAYTDLVIGATNTQLTSAGNPFSSVDAGNIINITGGTGFTTGRYTVVSVSGTTATMDRAVGTASSTGGTGNLGGALLTIQTANSSAVADNIIYIKSGTYTFTSNMTVNTADLKFQGFNTTHTDLGTAPVLTTSTNSLNMITSNNSASLTFINMTFTSTAATGGNAFLSNSSSNAMALIQCKVNGWNIGVNGDFNGDDQFALLRIIKCEITGCTSHGIINNNASTNTIVGSFIHGNGGDGINTSTTSTGGSIVMSDSIITGNAVGILLGTNASLIIFNSTIANNTGDGIDATTTRANPGQNGLMLQNTILYGNGAWGINSGTNLYPASQSFNNAYGANTSGNKQNFNDINPITLTATPFVNSGSNNFALNTSAGGGALLTNAGYPGVFPGATTTSFTSVGAVQNQLTSGGTGGSFPFVM